MAVARAVLFRLATNERLERIVRAVPGGESQAWRAASRYVAGRSQDQALATADDLLAQGHGVSVDLFGELVRDQAAAEQVVDDYVALACALPAPPADVWLSLDLSHLAIDSDPAGAANRLATITQALSPGRRLQVGAEDSARTEAIQACMLTVAGRGLADRLGVTVQANLRRSERDVDTLVAAGVHVRLVKGAYLETTGTHPYGEPTDVAYLRASRRTRSGVAAARRRGQLRGRAPKLTDYQERHVVGLYWTGRYTVSEIGELFDVSRSTVYRAVRRAAQTPASVGAAVTSGQLSSRPTL